MTSVGVVHEPRPDAALRVLLAADEAGGALGAVEMVMPRGAAGPPLHRHLRHAESFYVLAGRVTLQVGEAVVTGGPGTWATAPSGAAHTLANLADDDARVLCLFTPGGFERRFQRMLADPHEARALTDLHEYERATEVLGPPLGAGGPS